MKVRELPKHRIKPGLKMRTPIYLQKDMIGIVIECVPGSIVSHRYANDIYMTVKWDRLEGVYRYFWKLCDYKVEKMNSIIRLKCLAR